LAVIVLAGFLDGQTQFLAANVAGHDLRLFPKDGQAAVINIQFPVRIFKFASDGRSLYASLPIDQMTKQQPSLVRIDFNPIRITELTGTQRFTILDFAVTQDGNKVVISGRHREGAFEKCGLFEITVSTGLARQVLAADCPRCVVIR